MGSLFENWLQDQEIAKDQHACVLMLKTGISGCIIT